MHKYQNFRMRTCEMMVMLLMFLLPFTDCATCNSSCWYGVEKYAQVSRINNVNIRKERIMTDANARSQPFNNTTKNKNNTHKAQSTKHKEHKK